MEFVQNPKYNCPVHGEIYDYLNVSIGNDYHLNGSYCMHCILEKYIKDIPKVEPID